MAAATGMVMLLAAALAILAPPARALDRGEFPSGFLFGAATSAYQLRHRRWKERGRSGRSLPPVHGTKSADRQSLLTNCHVMDLNCTKYQCTAAIVPEYEDVDLMHNLGVNSYRFSISWARILPRGRLGGINSAGIAFYDRLIDALLQKGIEPFVTLHHFDLPYELETSYGSWLGAGIREEFDYYADVCFQAFGDRVKFWTTFNEPNLFTKFAYMLGVYSPKRCSPPFGNCNSGNSQQEPYVAAHNIIMSHAAAVDNYKKNYQAKQGGSIGIVISMKFYEPLTNTMEDILAAQQALAFEIHWFLDPIFFGEYPKEMREMLSSDLPEFTPAEKRLLQNKVDFIGVNHYTAIYTKDCISSPCDLNTYEGNALVFATGERDGVQIREPTALCGFYDVPEGMEQILRYVNQRYENAPVYVTENGYSQYNNNNMEDMINDVGRVNYLQGFSHVSLQLSGEEQRCVVTSYGVSWTTSSGVSVSP
ncbi:hypothetical protein ACQ4PT_070344 [Festuca glaucescens]